MTDPERDPDLSYDPADNDAAPDVISDGTEGDESSAMLDDASPDARNGSVGGTDGVTKNQGDTAQ